MLPGHPLFTGALHPDTRLVFLPPHTPSKVQPVDQGVIAAPKAYDLQRTLALAIAASEEDAEETRTQLWKDHDICDRIRDCAGGDATKEYTSGF